MNVAFYKKLLSFRTHSKSETQLIFREWLRQYIVENYENIQTGIDEYGNLYIQKGDAKIMNCVVAHLDINQKTKSDNIHIALIDNWVLGIDKDTGNQIGLGHDDKAGVYFALQALKKFDNLKVFFPLDEEIGCVGSRNCNPMFFQNVGFMVQLDRRGFKDISNYTNGNDVVTKETETELKGACEKYGYAFTRCVSTDVGYLVGILDIQGVNVSCGYYDEHSDKEVLNVNHYDNAEKFALSVLKITDGKKYEITQKKYNYPTSTYVGGTGTGYNRNATSGTGTNTTFQRKPNATNSSIGSTIRKSNANDHLILREDDIIDTHKGPASYVKSDEIDDIQTVVPMVLSQDQKVKDFRASWYSSASVIELAMFDTEVLIQGYKDTIKHLVMETVKSDEDVIDHLTDLDNEVYEVEVAGAHDLRDVHDEIKNNINTLKNFIKGRRAMERRSDVL